MQSACSSLPTDTNARLNSRQHPKARERPSTVDGRLRRLTVASLHYFCTLVWVPSNYTTPPWSSRTSFSPPRLVPSPSSHLIPCSSSLFHPRWWCSSTSPSPSSLRVAGSSHPPANLSCAGACPPGYAPRLLMIDSEVDGLVKTPRNRLSTESSRAGEGVGVTGGTLPTIFVWRFLTNPVYQLSHRPIRSPYLIARLDCLSSRPPKQASAH